MTTLELSYAAAQEKIKALYPPMTFGCPTLLKSAMEMKPLLPRLWPLEGRTICRMMADGWYS